MTYILKVSDWWRYADNAIKPNIVSSLKTYTANMSDEDTIETIKMALDAILVAQTSNDKFDKFVAWFNSTTT